ncbi:type II toxin-antitoxin system VapC family toxin [Chitinophaga sp. 22321]|uniref:PIN domain nuclease n=1 Tax=Chitinophaga hostae TaxID=2831022 RepID=A0ABS5ITQ5_9BACT|nr:PIN domain nuclease [Chitinophaga hostae]MBS0026329.1 PIN domain nuclease [Chitinophaga hostae]
MNQPLLFDTSVWIDSMRKKVTPQTGLLNYYLKNGFEIPVIPIVLQELLQGIRDDLQYRKTKEVMRRFTRLEIAPMATAIGASALFRTLRKKGVTIRKSNDCIIAFYAMSFDLEVVHNDSNFDLISAHSALKTWQNNKG